MGQRVKTSPTTAPFTIGVVDHIQSVQLSETRKLNIYLPANYNKDINTRYPIIYLLDGSANEDFIHITGIVQFLTMIEAMPQTIVIGIENVDRKRDFTFPTRNKQDLKDTPTSGKSAKFIAFIEKELQPYIEKKYRTNQKKTIIGQSLGGLLATEVLLKKPTLFNQYVIVSPSLWWDDESLLADAPVLLKASHNIRRQVYVLVGNEHKVMQEDAAKLADLLRVTADTTLQVNYTFLPDENHLTILHNAVYKALMVLNKKPE
ncbi:alpha/beta hydrolase [Mucilaginibacter sp. Bleaf8]|uniref:alpha/beta hydrolase n=1 Tax=Mucilaginibacter sp. Bleaf8 TaxID=2834430 RepID=UPI001BCCA708|nr:alpha/beta hydrolase-fold protein [Mucilaginibacter sp. Bleaf8]MBS7564282.1 alpha/beta hydrolase [Mucilaginibacter sp. Bleaf8]